MTENQFQELFRLVTTAVAKISNVEDKVDGLEKRFDGLEKRFDGLETEFHEFRGETQANFQKLEKQLDKEIKSLNVRDARREKEVADLQVEIEEIAKRVEILEQKAA